MMRFAGRTAPGNGSGPLTGHRLAAPALSTTNPFRPPVHVLRAGLAVVSAFRDAGGCAALAADGFEDDFALVPNDSARTPGLAVSVAGAGAWLAAGVAPRADARRNTAIRDCTACST